MKYNSDDDSFYGELFVHEDKETYFSGRFLGCCCFTLTGKRGDHYRIQMFDLNGCPLHNANMNFTKAWGELCMVTIWFD